MKYKRIITLSILILMICSCLEVGFASDMKLVLSNELNTDIIKLKIEEVEKDLGKIEMELDKQVPQVVIENINEKIELISNDLNDLDEKIDELGADSLKKSTISWILGVLGALGINVLGMWIYMIRYFKKYKKNLEIDVSKELNKILADKNVIIEKLIEKHDFENKMKIGTKILTISNDQFEQEKIRLILNNIFEVKNLEFELYNDELCRDISQERISKLSEFDIIFFNNNGNLMDLKACAETYRMFIEDIDRKINKNDNKICYFYYNKSNVRLNTNSIKHNNFANSESTIYYNLMALLKYKEEVM